LERQQLKLIGKLVTDFGKDMDAEKVLLSRIVLKDLLSVSLLDNA
jgi:hypothetical protein